MNENKMQALAPELAKDPRTSDDMEEHLGDSPYNSQKNTKNTQNGYTK